MSVRVVGTRRWRGVVILGACSVGRCEFAFTEMQAGVVEGHGASFREHRELEVEEG
jgi:hypothetical protein